MKNYLLKHGERGFEREVQLARARLRGDEFLNLDALLESVMQKLVAVPLREHLYALFVDWCATRGDIELMAENIKLAAEYEPRELGLRVNKIRPFWCYLYYKILIFFYRHVLLHLMEPQ